MQVGLAASRGTAVRMANEPNLDPARERDLLARARSTTPNTDSRAALTELWMSHGKLVASIASKYRRADVDFDDLINAGHLGLHTAIMRFDTKQFDGRLSSYAMAWIRWYITDYIRRNATPVRLPESKGHRQLAQSGARLLAEARKACQREGIDATDSELHERIGRRVGLSADEVAHGLRLLQGARKSLHAEEDDEADPGLRDHAAPTADELHERIDHDRLRIRIRALVNEILGERERALFMARSMATSDDVPSLDAFAERFGISVTRVHQIEISARRKIAVALAASGYANVTGDGVVAHLAQIRARRAARAPVGSAARAPVGSAARARAETMARLHVAAE
jgi:RNA polymerase sigma-32 factor